MGGETDAVSGEAARTGSSLSVIISPVGCRTTELCNSVGSLSVVEILDDREQEVPRLTARYYLYCFDLYFQ